MGERPTVSILIITWNSRSTLPRCLEGLKVQTFRDFEVIVVDNGSEDGCADGLEDSYPELNLTLHRLEENRGYATGNNLAARLARGEWLALLNADAFPEPDWLARLVEAACIHPEFGSFSSRLIQERNPELLDGEGDTYHISGLAWRRNHGRPVVEDNVKREVFSACGAASFIRKEFFFQAGGFDELYFAYNEDVDLGFRMQLAGHRCLFIPEAKVLHAGSTSTGYRSDTTIYYGHRNLVWTYFKDMPAFLILLLFPSHLWMTVAYMIYFSLIGRGGIIWRAKIDALHHLPRILNQRSGIQSSRVIPIRTVLSLMSKKWLLQHWAERLGT